MTFVIGLTGSIATGKSTVLALFAEKGIPVYSADKAVHDLYSGEAVARITKLFPQTNANGQIDRRKLAEALVRKPEKLRELEAIVHPMVRDRAQAFIEKHQRAKADLCVLEIPLLFESRPDYALDAIVVTWCDPELQRQRALSRNGMNVEKFEALLARQVPQAEKKDRADFLIDTATTIENTRMAVDQIVAECRARNRSQPRA